MAARAFSSQKPALQHSSRATVTRAAPDSSQSSGTDSPDSGRLRRRRGKLKMQARIVELEGRLHTLLEVIHQLTSSPADVSRHTAAMPPGVLGLASSAEFFDLFADGTSFTDAMVQTDISVDWNRPDIFVHVPQQGLECQPSLSLDAQLSEASVDASGALDGKPRHNEQHSLDRVLPGAVDGTLQQAPDDVHARHCSVSQQQSRDVVLARHCNMSHEPDSILDRHCGVSLALGAACMPSCEPTTHNRLRNLTSISQEHDAAPQCAADIHLFSQGTAHADAAAGHEAAHVTLNRLPDYTGVSQDSSQQELADDNAKHRVSFSPARPFALEHREQRQDAKASQSTRQEQDVANALHRVSHPADFNSQSLAIPAVGDFAASSGTISFGTNEQLDCALPPPSPRRELDAVNAKHRGTSISDKEHHQDVTAKHRDSVPLDFNSRNLALHTRPFAVVLQEQPCGQPCTRQELEDDNARHRESVSTDLNSHNLARAARPFAFEHEVQRLGEQAPHGTRQEHDDVKSMHRVSGSPVFDSQSLAISAFDKEHLQCAPLSSRQALDVVVTAKHRDFVPSDFNSQSLALRARPFVVEHQEQHCNQPCTRQELDEDNAMHRVSVSTDFNPQNHAQTARPIAFEHNEQRPGVKAPPGTRQEHDVVNAMHRVSGPLDFNSQSLAISAFENQTSPRQELDVDNAKHRGTGTPSGDKEYPQCEPAPQSSRQEHEVLNAMHTVSGPTDFNSQGLVISAFINLAEQLVTHAKHRMSGSFDFNSQNLATPSSVFAFGSEEHSDRAQPPPSPRQELDDDNAKHRGTPIGDWEHRQCEHAPQNSRQALDDDNAKHRDFVPQDFNSQSLAMPAEPFAFEHLEQQHNQRNTRQERDVDNATHRVSLSNDSNSPLTFGPSTRELQKPLADYNTAVAPVIAAYCRRNKPSNGQVRRAAATICGIAKKHGVTKEQCCHHLQNHSLALMTAATDLW